MNPEQIKQEQERVSKLVRDYDRTYEVLLRHDAARRKKCDELAAASDDWDLPETTREHKAAFRAYKCVEEALRDRGLYLARAHLALLDAHLALHAQLAQAEGREKALREERDAYRKGLTTLINVHVNVPSAGDMRDVWERNAWKHAEGIVAQYGCESCAGLTFEDGTIACWTCGRVLPDAQAGATAQESLQVQPAQEAHND